MRNCIIFISFLFLHNFPITAKKEYSYFYKKGGLKTHLEFFDPSFLTLPISHKIIFQAKPKPLSKKQERDVCFFAFSRTNPKEPTIKK